MGRVYVQQGFLYEEDEAGGSVREATRTERLLAAEIDRLSALLMDCAEHFKTLREANVFVWPNHPLNPENRIAEALRKP